FSRVKENKRHEEELQMREKEIISLKHTRLQGNRNSNIIKQELKLLQSVTVDDSLHWIKDAFTNLFNEELTWLQGIEDSLEMCGYNIKSSDQGPAKYIENLQIRVENEIKEKEDIKLKLTTIESEVRSEMNSQVSDLKREHEMHVSDVVEKIRAEADQKVHLAVDEVRQAEMEKRLEAIEAEKLKRQDLQQTIDEMRQAVTMKGEQEKEHMTVVTEIEQQMEEMRVVEMKLKDEMVNKEIQFKEEMKQLRDQHEDEKRSHYTEVAAYKEQVRQHAVTIVAMEERLLKITQQQKEMEEERSDLKQQIERIRSKPVPPPKPAVPSKPVIVQAGPDIQALEQLVQVLRRESNDYKKEMQDQQDIILGLRRDLAGASARLSDMTGELSERQKQEMENNLTLMKDMEQELMTQRQQMAKLSELVDKQTNEARKLQAELSDERKLLSRSQNENKQKSEEVVALQSQLSSVQQTQQEITVKKEQEGVIATELASFGAQCRGERHEQVIARQREALAELRSRIKGLEQSRPPIPSGDQALQQVVLLKKELAEMRAQQVSLSGSNGFNIQDATLDQKIAEARGQIPPSVSDTAIERSARIETQEALEESEKTVS
ncbi:forkhead-associated domain-containing protein 1-like, partial [Saccoglossus kowalevskii]|uniref:Forkhead-associated domain-containing protein 1-like n=1 Tax=Saccoglossus kowalevskii TaxID=10224 RepID=A0ABM0GIM6_SACKO